MTSFCQRHFIKAHPNLFKPLMKFGGTHEEDISIETCDPLNTTIAYVGLKKLCAPQSLTPTQLFPSLQAIINTGFIEHIHLIYRHFYRQ